MALLVPNQNPSNEHNAQLAFPSAKCELPQHTTKGRDLAPNQKGHLSETGTSRVKRLVPLFSKPLVAKMSKCPNACSFEISRFAKSGHKEYPCSLESLVAEKPKCPSTLSFGFL